MENAGLPRSSGAPSLSSPALGGGSSLDSATVSFPVRLAVEARRRSWIGGGGEEGAGGEGVREDVAGTAWGRGGGGVGWSRGWTLVALLPSGRRRSGGRKRLPKASSSSRLRRGARSSGVWVLPEEYSVWFLGDEFWLVSKNSIFFVRQWIQYMRESPVLLFFFRIFLCEGGPRLLRSILAATCPYGCLQAHDAPLGRYGPEGHNAARQRPRSSTTAAVACLCLVLLVGCICAVFLSFVGMSVMPGITDFAVLEVATLVVDSSSGMYKIGIAGFYASRLDSPVAVHLVVDVPAVQVAVRSTSLSWRRGRFPWSFRPWTFPSCWWTR